MRTQALLFFTNYPDFSPSDTLPRVGPQADHTSAKPQPPNPSLQRMHHPTHVLCLLDSFVTTSVRVNILTTIVLIAFTTKCGGVLLVGQCTNLIPSITWRGSWAAT